MLLGCKAGKEKGIASEIALATGAKVFASEGLVTGVRRTRFGGIQLLDAQGENTVVHGVGPLQAAMYKLRNLMRRRG